MKAGDAHEGYDPGDAYTYAFGPFDSITLDVTPKNHASWAMTWSSAPVTLDQLASGGSVTELCDSGGAHSPEGIQVRLRPACGDPDDTPSLQGR